MDTASTMVVSVWEHITLAQIIPLTISFLAAMLGLYRFWLRKKLETLKQNDEQNFRYRQLEMEDRAKFQAGIVHQMERMRAENLDLQQRLYASEKEKVDLIKKIAELQAEVISLRGEVERVTAQLLQLRGEYPHAANG